MHAQDRLINAVDIELTDVFGLTGLYESFCGKLLLEDLFTTDTVYISAVRAASGFRDKADTAAFMASPWQNARKLQKKVLNGTFRPVYFPIRVINERGKMREIKPPTFECKVVQKVICDYLIRPLLEPKMIDTTYASVKGRGTSLMHQNILHALNSRAKSPHAKDTRIVLTDFSRYFASISQEILFEDVFAKYIRDERILKLMRSFSPDDFGLSLGNELSQIPASFFPNKIDHWSRAIKKQQLLPLYG